MFPPDDTHSVDDATESAACAATNLLHSPLLQSQLDVEYGEENVSYVDGVEHLEHNEPLEQEHKDLPNFALIFYELSKLESSWELVDVKSKLLKIKRSLMEEEEAVSVILDKEGDKNDGTIEESSKSKPDCVEPVLNQVDSSAANVFQSEVPVSNTVLNPVESFPLDCVEPVPASNPVTNPVDSSAGKLYSQ